ncbi:MAG: YqaJ viral recombinase family protein [Parachlamydia sp.]|nr:YqaJ viral recombinase family protein [Parachlamydia sp.]
MKIINLEQNTPEWLEFRRGKIGASDAPIIMGVSPYRTAYELYLDKTEGITQAKNEAMKRGSFLEDDARRQLKLDLRLSGDIGPAVLQSEEHEEFIASLDCFTPETGFMSEIKCPNEADHLMAVAGKIPEKYYPQLQHQMYVAGASSNIYYSYRQGQGVFVVCPRDNEYIAKLVQKEMEFIENVRAGIPPALSDKDFVERFDMEFLTYARSFELLKEQISELQTKEQALKDKLIEIAAGQNCRAGNVRVSKRFRKGSVEYAKIPQLAEIDLEQYRGKPTSYHVITVC